MKDFSTQLRNARGKLKREEAAKLLGVSVSALDKWESGIRIPARLALPELMRRLPLLSENQP